MSISLKTHKILWAKSGNRCAMPDCRKELVENETETDDPSVIGDEAHIVAREQDGPRGESELPKDDRDKFDNLLLLCKIHHKIIDDQVEYYTVEKLKEIKKQHLFWVSEQLSQDQNKINDDQIYATYIDKWIELAEIDNWKNWATDVLSNGQPYMSKLTLDRLNELNQYLFSRIWPKRYNELEISFNNFRIILNDFIQVFKKYTIKVGDEEDTGYYTEKIYKRADYTEPEKEYNLLFKFNYHVDLVQDLMLELTRASNLICDKIRAYISKNFRIQEGALLVSTGPDMTLSWKTVKVEYDANSNLDNILYKGLREFMEYRTNYQYNFGEGVSDDYFPIKFNI